MRISKTFQREHTDRLDTTTRSNVIAVLPLIYLSIHSSSVINVRQSATCTQ